MKLIHILKKKLEYPKLKALKTRYRATHYVAGVIRPRGVCDKSIEEREGFQGIRYDYPGSTIPVSDREAWFDVYEDRYPGFFERYGNFLTGGPIPPKTYERFCYESGARRPGYEFAAILTMISGMDYFEDFIDRIKLDLRGNDFVFTTKCPKVLEGENIVPGEVSVRFEPIGRRQKKRLRKILSE